MPVLCGEALRRHLVPREAILSEQPFRPRPRPTSGDAARAEHARAEAAYARFPRQGNNPWTNTVEPPRIAYQDPTGEAAVANADRDLKHKRAT